MVKVIHLAKAKVTVVKCLYLDILIGLTLRKICIREICGGY